MPASERGTEAGVRRGSGAAAAPGASGVTRNFRPALSFSGRQTVTELGREVSACPS